MQKQTNREIPYNYTSADDAQIVRILFDGSVWRAMEKLRFQRKTGRLARLLMRLMGDLFIVRRNPFIYQALVDDGERRSSFLKGLLANLDIIEAKSVDSEFLSTILSSCRTYINDLSKELEQCRRFRSRVVKVLGSIVGEENVCFDPFSLIGHATDATDWRLHLPVAVIRPETEKQIAPLLSALADLGLRVIPRGGGTGLTGGAVPVENGCAIINTEKLNRIRGIEMHPDPVVDMQERETAVLHLEAGVITGDAISYAENKGYVFATDPTSSWACTIGGNIAENAGGKKAVLWGTAIDNIWSYRIAVPGGRHLEVRRVDHPLRRILPEDRVRFDITDLSDGSRVGTVDLSGTDIRKKGLGKDITNKALGGLPGLQKEGTDGVVTSAKFILHRAYPFQSTACLEFFGDDMDEAARVICDISDAFVNRGEEALMALEHFDEEYVRAIGYKTKAPRKEMPKAVLLVDMVGHTTVEIDRARRRLTELLSPYPNTSVFFAADENEAMRYWQDRKRLGAIAARTNAFKLNEDIVLPLPALADFADFVDRYNIEEERYNQKSLVWQIGNYLESAEPIADPQWLSAKLSPAKELMLDTIEKLTYAGKYHLREETHIRKLQEDLADLFRGYSRVLGEVEKVYVEMRAHLIVIATHMHAGDGNVHVNIPVFSNDREMMIRAAETAEAVMAEAVALGGVVSGEHGIGFTKLAFVDPERLDELAAYRREVDPQGLMNPAKLSDLTVTERVFTPSFNLLGLEAQILQHASLNDLAGRISKCIRCGRCKADCCTFYPARNLFFHPRNKNLAIAALIEALLYDAQRSRSVRFGFLHYLEEIADHCTICHKCASPCPVDIDTGSVSILERRILKKRRVKSTRLLTKLTLNYLDNREKWPNAIFRRGVLRWGSLLQRTGATIFGSYLRSKSISRRSPLAHFSSPVTPVAPRSLRGILPACKSNQSLYFRPPVSSGKVVFYFPGCGSERLFSQIGMASLYTLLRSGAEVILPPPFLCCGYPAKVNADQEHASGQVLRDTIILSQIREMFGHLSFNACVVSCGTCREALGEQGVEAVFGAPLLDVALFACRNGLSFQSAEQVCYHRPCHDSLQGEAEKLFAGCGAGRVPISPHCCGEAGTLALSRPDIGAAMRSRKRESLSAEQKKQGTIKVVLTNCPSCIQGLGRQSDFGIAVRHLAVELAQNAGGVAWEKELQHWAAAAEVVTF